MALFKISKRTTSPEVTGWYQDKIGSAVTQRNFLFLLILLLLGVLAFSVLTIFTLTKAKGIEPFIIEVSSKSGIVTLVDPITIKSYSADRKISDYFLVTYLKAREAFDPATYEYNYYTIVRLFSAPRVYYDFRSTLKPDNKDNPINLYRDIKNLIFKIRSIQYLPNDTVQVRFALEFVDGGGIIRKNKIAIISYQYKDLQLTEEERYINPLGFFITYYKVDDEYL